MHCIIFNQIVTWLNMFLNKIIMYLNIFVILISWQLFHYLIMYFFLKIKATIDKIMWLLTIIIRDRINQKYVLFWNLQMLGIYKAFTLKGRHGVQIPVLSRFPSGWFFRLHGFRSGGLSGSVSCHWALLMFATCS